MSEISSQGNRPNPLVVVKALVVPYIRVECKFWPDNDGWNAEALGLMIHAPDLELAKSYMEAALGRRIEELLQRDLPQRTTKADAA